MRRPFLQPILFLNILEKMLDLIFRLIGEFSCCYPLRDDNVSRSFYATTLYRAGIDLKTTQYLLGHATIQMTANVYTHMEKEDAAASVIQLEQYLSGGSQEGTQAGGDFSESSQKVVSGES